MEVLVEIEYIRITKTTIMKILSKICILLFVTTLAACGDKSTPEPNDNDQDPPKTLTKDYLYDKNWYNKGGGILHLFHSDGKWGLSKEGTWHWKNNSDTMTVSSPSGTREWIFLYNTEDEFTAKWDGTEYVFRDRKW